jgi:hypothetical protein
MKVAWLQSLAVAVAIHRVAVGPNVDVTVAVLFDGSGVGVTPPGGVLVGFAVKVWATAV